MIEPNSGVSAAGQAPTPLILLLGYRKGALRAARNLGFEVGLIHQNDLPPKVKNELSFLEMSDFQQEPERAAAEILDRVGPKLQGRRICGVLALTEKSVVVAAHLRKFLQLPGISPESALIAHDKWNMKEKAAEIGVPLTPYHLFQDEDYGEELSGLIETWGLPIVIKERSLSGGRSMKICFDKESLAQNAHPNLLAEKFIQGVEVSVEAFLYEGKVVFRNFTQYYIPWSVNILPAPIPADQMKEIVSIHEKILQYFRIERGMTHMEFYLTQHGPVFGELAIRPPGGYIMELIEHAYGLKAWEALIKIELGESVKFPSSAEKMAASWVIHPGAGCIDSLIGSEDISKIPEVKQMKLKILPGDRIEERLGAGEDRGCVIFSGNDHQRLVRAIEQARSLLKIHWKT